MSNSFHNTVQAKGEQLALFESIAKGQETRIYAYMKLIGGEHTPEHIWEEVFFSKVPLTSVRRALTNLTRKGLLAKSIEPVEEGIYGRYVHTWRII